MLTHHSGDDPYPTSEDQPEVKGSQSESVLLELEMRALAELLLDIYEWRHQEKHRNISGASSDFPP